MSDAQPVPQPRRDKFGVKRCSDACSYYRRDAPWDFCRLTKDAVSTTDICSPAARIDHARLAALEAMAARAHGFLCRSDRPLYADEVPLSVEAQTILARQAEIVRYILGDAPTAPEHDDKETQ